MARRQAVRDRRRHLGDPPHADRARVVCGDDVAVWSRLIAVLDAPRRVEPRTRHAPHGDVEGPALLQDIAFDLPAGQALAIIGPSGAGKSTLVRLLCGALPASAGAVRLDGVELGQWPLAQLVTVVGVLPQDVAFFDGTVAENIARMGEVDAARVPEAHLDETGVQALCHAVQGQLQGGGSVVLVSSHPALLQAADQKIVLREGRVAECSAYVHRESARGEPMPRPPARRA